MVDPKLVTLLCVCETGSFTRAAEALTLTQPAVSQHIKQLEKELDIKLFNRSGERGNSLKLTPEGETTVRFARRIVSLYNNLSRSLQDEKRKQTHITIGITHTSESNPVIEALAKYSSENKACKIILITDTIKNLYDKLRTYEIDIAIVEGGVAEPGYSSILLDTDSLVLVVSNDHPFAKKGVVTISELKKERLILRLSDSGTQNLFVSHLESRNLSIEDFNVILEVDNVATIKDLIRRGYGVSILAKSACLDEQKKGKLTLLPVENLSMMREISIVYHQDFDHPEILREISRMYSEAVKLYKGN